jgi:Flp pilus assembly protein TadG
MNNQRQGTDMAEIAGDRVILKSQVGATAVMIAVMASVLIGFVALAIDIGYLMVTKNELQNVADGSALAAGRQLGVIYGGMSYEEQQSYVCDPAPIISVAREVGLKNMAASKWITINDADIEIGTWSAGSFSTTLNRPNAVRVTARRDSGANGSVPTFFATALGVDLMDASAKSVAALTGKSTTDPGELELPVGISRAWFDSHPGVPCGDHIKFYPSTDPDACAGWTTYTSGANTANLRKILDGDLTSSASIAGETDFEFTGGVSAASFSNLILLFQRKGYDVYDIDAGGNPCSDPEPCWIRNSAGEPVNLADDPTAVYYDAQGTPGVTPTKLIDSATGLQLEYPVNDADPDYPPPAQRPRNKHAWETSVAVYSNLDGTADCFNPNQSLPVVGYARIRLTDVVDAPAKLVVGELVCDYVDSKDSRGGGGESFALMGSIPGLVQ